MPLAACTKKEPTTPFVPYALDYRDSITGYWIDTVEIRRSSPMGTTLESHREADTITIRKLGTESLAVTSKHFRFRANVGVYGHEIRRYNIYYFSNSRNDTAVHGLFIYYNSLGSKTMEMRQYWEFDNPNNEELSAHALPYFYKPLQ